MKKFFRKITLWILLFALLPTAYFSDQVILRTGSFSPDPDWAGVLRIWASASAPFGAGSGLSWFNSQAAAYEKSHPGVRIQFIEIAPEVLPTFSSADHPPDGLIFTPGVLPTADNLIALAKPASLVDSLSRCGENDGEFKALPVAMGGYCWLCADNQLSCAPGTVDCPPVYTFHLPADSPTVCYSAALLALFTGAMDSAPQSIYPGADLGLPQPTATAEPALQAALLRKPASFAPDIRSHASVRALFASGQTGAIIATAQDLTRLRQLADEGRAPEFSLYPGGTSFTDQLAMAAVVDASGPDSADRERLCADFFAYLLSEKSQQALASVRAFRVTKGDPLYSTSRDGMAEAEAALRRGLIVPNAFDNAWRERAGQAAQLFLETDASAADLFHNIFP